MNLYEKLLREGIKEEIAKLFKIIKREWFVPEEYKNFAEEDIVIPLKEDVTISQPYVLARMLELLDVREGNKILEIGTGSGFSTALLSILTGKNGKVVSIEIDKYAHEYAKSKLEELIKKGIIYDNIILVYGDGKYGYVKESPYDRIIIHAATEYLSDEIINQLNNYGIIVVPLGYPESKLYKIIKENNKLKFIGDIDVLFVKLK